MAQPKLAERDKAFSSRKVNTIYQDGVPVDLKFVIPDTETVEEYAGRLTVEQELDILFNEDIPMDERLRLVKSKSRNKHNHKGLIVTEQLEKERKEKEIKYHSNKFIEDE